MPLDVLRRCADDHDRATLRLSEPSVRRELADLQSALNHAWRSRKLMVKVPVALPDAARPRERWLTRAGATRLLWGCLGFELQRQRDARTGRETWKCVGRRHDSINRHAARFILLGLWTGTRHEAILALGWHQHLGGGWPDLERVLLYQAAPRAAQTTMRKPPAPLPARLLRLMVRWRRLDGDGLHIVSWQGERIAKMRRAFGTAVRLAGLGDDVTPHVLRHTCATWLVQAGVPLWEVAGYLGMTVETGERVYGHHAPDHLQRAARALR